MEGQASLPPSYAGTLPSKWGWDLDLPFLLTTQPMFAEQPYDHFLLVPVSPWFSEDTIAPSWTRVHGSILPVAWPGRGAQLPRNLCPPDPPNTARHDYVQLPWTRRQAKHTYITNNLGSRRACGNRHEHPGLLTKPYSGWSALGRIRMCALGQIRMGVMDQGILEGADGKPGVPLCYHRGIRPAGL